MINIQDSINDKTILNTNNNYRKNFILYFVFLFIIGNFIVGIYESAYLEHAYVYNIFTNINNIHFLHFIEIFIPAIFLGYSIVSSYIAYVHLSTYNKVFIIFFIIYYLLFVWFYTFYQFSSPIAYLASYIYNGISNQIWDCDIITYYNNKIV